MLDSKPERYIPAILVSHRILDNAVLLYSSKYLFLLQIQSAKEIYVMDLQQYLTKQEYLLSAEHMKQSHSPDYTEGFEDGVRWLRDYIILELLNCQKYQQENSD